MAKKPSEWTPQEAWAAALETAERNLKRGGWPDVVYAIDRIPFPADPPEVVSDEWLASAADRSNQGGNYQLAFRELLARREAERKP